jgi:5-amino-6-(5-phosphoribosylamino)uracil reductase/diaminohydroxyphosphoribosylaminopyrimidine deaminase/5-amino-6-(5-phosphoribosylamino)uracil reductase
MKITIAYAQTLDGRIATRTGDSQWIGGPESLRVAHQLRADHDAVLVGAGTVIADNPRLTTRLVEGRSPLRVIADSRLRIPLDANVVRDRSAFTLIVTTEQAPPARRRQLQLAGAEVAMVPANGESRVDLRALVDLLSTRGISSLLVEGGAGIITAVLRERLADRLVVCIAPRILGHGIEAVGDLRIDRLSDAMALRAVTVTRCGDDLILDGELAAVATVAG